MDLIIGIDGLAIWGERKFKCALGKNGIKSALEKTEGDKSTPAGGWVMREVLYRADRMHAPTTSLPFRSINIDDGWCDEPKDVLYNKPVKHPYTSSAERLWLEDNRYDVIVVLGYNDEPVCAGKGSAIFLHVARPDYSPTAGCVALDIKDLLLVLSNADNSSRVNVVL